MGFADFDIMGKCKKILSKMDLLSEDIVNALTPLVEVLGTTADAGGTETAGTAMAKLNALIGINTEHGSVEFTTAGSRTWTCPQGVSMVYAIMQGGTGGGGGGGGGLYTSFDSDYYLFKPTGGGAGGAPCVYQFLIPVVAGQSYEIVVGAGGVGGAAGVKGATYKTEETESGTNYRTYSGGDGGAGGRGGSTKFGSLASVGGGGGGAAGKGGRSSERNLGKPLSGGGGDNGSAQYSYATMKNIRLHQTDGSAGGNGGTPPDGAKGNTNGYNSTVTVVSGGSNRTTAIGNKSGAGGAGGKNGYAGTGNSLSDGTAGTDGSKGSAGAAGCIKIFW